MKDEWREGAQYTILLLLLLGYGGPFSIGTPSFYYHFLDTLLYYPSFFCTLAYQSLKGIILQNPEPWLRHTGLDIKNFVLVFAAY